MTMTDPVVVFGMLCLSAFAAGAVNSVAGGGTLVLLDEVLTGLQHEEAVEIGRVIRAVSADLGTAFIVVEHVMGTLMPIIDRLVVMDAGAVIADGIPDEVIRMKDVEVAYFGRGVNDGR